MERLNLVLHFSESTLHQMIDTAFPGHFHMCLEQTLPEPLAPSVQVKYTIQLSITQDLGLYHFNYFSLKRSLNYFGNSSCLHCCQIASKK